MLYNLSHELDTAELSSLSDMHCAICGPVQNCLLCRICIVLSVVLYRIVFSVGYALCYLWSCTELSSLSDMHCAICGPVQNCLLCRICIVLSGPVPSFSVQSTYGTNCGGGWEILFVVLALGK